MLRRLAEELGVVPLADTYPHIHRIVVSVTHDDASVVVGRGCDDQFEFEFALHLKLDGLERIRAGN